MASTQEQWNGNVWINDQWTDEDKTQALKRLALTTPSEEQLKKQSQALSQFRRNAGTNWNVFYEQNQNKFFKDRHYLHKAFSLEFAWLYPDDEEVNDCIDGASTRGDTAQECSKAENVLKSQRSLEYWKQHDKIRVVEIGCGVGNAILPMLEQHSRLMEQQNKRSGIDNNAPLPQLHIHCLDFAPNAIQILKEDKRFESAASEGRATAHVYDLSSMHPSTISLDEQTTLANSADVAILLFCLSAIGPHPSQDISRAARHVIDMLRPGGVLVIRDYGRLDEAQLKLGKGNKELGENFYQKGDGTGCYYFELDDLRELFGNVSGETCSNKLDMLELDYIQRVYRNRGESTTRRRVWVHGRFKKPLHSSAETNKSASSLMQTFLNTSIQRWDNYYESQDEPSQTVSLNDAIFSKYPNNLLQIFPDEFKHWKSLLGLTNGSKRKLQGMNVESPGTPSIVIDLGCGKGNGTLLNILAQQQVQASLLEDVMKEHPCKVSESCHKLNVHFIDASSQAILKLRNDVRYKYVESDDSTCVSSKVYDITTSKLPHRLESLADTILLLYTLSAVGPYQHQMIQKQNNKLECALENIAKMLKPGGIVLFRDFGRYDDDQLQLNSCFGSQICNNFYFRDDSKGTAVYFFSMDEVRNMFTRTGFEVLQLDCLRRPYTKSGKNCKDLSMNGGAMKRTRIWIHGRFRKSI